MPIQSMPKRSSTPTPDVIGKYRIINQIAQGGMGAVFKAVHPSLRRDVIIKKLTLRTGNSSIRERFKREAQILMDLSSPYIVRMFDFFTEARNDYIVLEFVDGMSLDKLLEKQQSLSPQLALLIFLDACYGLKHAHSKGIVHRDIKPGNILISRRAEVKLSDFGIASGEKENDSAAKQKTADSNATVVAPVREGITMTGAKLGTPAYMSPEQLDDSSSVDQRADIYSMGIMLYEMVTGTKPYKGDMSSDTLQAIRKGDYEPPERFAPKLPRFVSSLIKKMMRADKQKRFQSIDPVIKKIKRYLKKYDQHAIRVNLAQAVIATKEIRLPQAYQTRHHKAVRNSLIVVAVLAFMGLIAAGWFSKFFLNTVLRHWYTPVSLAMEMPENNLPDTDLPARAFFYVNDNKEIPLVDEAYKLPAMSNNIRDFYTPKVAKGAADGNEESAKKPNRKNVKVVTKPVYLKPGDYRVKIVEGPYIWWNSITVGKEAQTLEFNFLKNARRYLKVRTNAIDAQTGADITDQCKFMVETPKGLKDLATLPAESLLTGTVHRFHITAPGYHEEYFGLRIEWYEDELFLNGSLKKK